jgi:uncharacterized protein with HEPN domain
MSAKLPQGIDLSTRTCVKLPNISWIEMIGMRNRVAHGYWEIEFDIVWNTVRDELPKLVDSIDTVLKQERKQD